MATEGNGAFVTLAHRTLSYTLRSESAERVRLRLRGDLHTASMSVNPRERGSAVNEATVRVLRAFFAENHVVPTDGYLLPVTVSDGLGRWAPAVFLARLPGDDWDGVLDAVTRGLAPLRTLAPDEELVWTPVAADKRLNMRSSQCHVYVAVGPNNNVIVNAASDAWRHAACGNAACDRLFSDADPRLACARHATVADLHFSVMPRHESHLRRVMYHRLAPGPHGRAGDVAAIPVAPLFSPLGSSAAMAIALRGQFPPGYGDNPNEVPWVSRRQDVLSWRPEDVHRLAARTILEPDLELWAARKEQVAFFELLTAAFSLYPYNTTERAFITVTGLEELAAPGTLTLALDVRYMVRPETRDANPFASLSRSILRFIGSADLAWSAIHSAFVPALMSQTEYHVPSEDAVLEYAEATSAELAPTADPTGLSPGLELRPAQAKALGFMLASEDGQPLMEMLSTPVMGGLYAYCAYLRGGASEYRSSTSPFGVVYPTASVPLRHGGVIANRAGTGKTILALSLVLARPRPSPAAPRATLVLCPASIVTQWVSETARAAPGLRVVAMRSGQALDVAAAASDQDVVVCGFPAMFHARHTAIAAVEWHRIVLDEAHLARHQGVLLASLRTSRAWCMSGTPMGTGGSARDMTSLLRFVTGFVGQASFAPASHKNVRMINLMNYHEVAPFFDLVRKTVARVSDEADATRATRDEVVRLPLPEDARAAYEAIEAESRADVINLATRSRDMMMRPLQRLRDWCAGAPALHNRLEFHPHVRAHAHDGTGGGGGVEDGPELRRNVGIPYDPAVHGVGYNDPDNDICTVCLEPLMYARLAMPPCRHWFCLPCVITSVMRWSRCPTCRTPAALASLRVQAEEVPVPVEPEPPVEEAAEAEAAHVEQEGGGAEEEAAAAAAPPAPIGPAPRSVFEAKVAGLVALAAAVGEGEKLIVFTRHTSLTHQFAEALTAAGVPAVHYTRRLPEQERNANKARFVTEPPAAVRAIVLDLANAEGIDGLQIARHVVFCEPFPATDTNQRSQAVSRCDRLGQERDVFVHTLVLAGTVEERLATYAPARTTQPIRRVRHYVGLEDAAA